MPVIARDAVASDHLVYAWPFPIGPEEFEVACADDEQVVLCPAWIVGGLLGPGRHRWRTPDPTRPVSAFFVLTAPVEVSFDMMTSFVMPTNGVRVRLRATGSLQVRCSDPTLLIAQFVGLPFDHVNEGVLRSVSKSVERMLARLLTRRVVMAGTPAVVIDPTMLPHIVEELVAYNPAAGAVFGIELMRMGRLAIVADDGTQPVHAHDANSDRFPTQRVGPNGDAARPASAPAHLLETIRSRPNPSESPAAPPAIAARTMSSPPVEASGEIRVRKPTPVPEPPTQPSPARVITTPVPAPRNAGTVEVPQSLDEITQPGIQIARTPVPGTLRVASPIEPEPEPEQEARGAILGIGVSHIGSTQVASGEIPLKIAPGARVLVPGPNGLMQSATVRQLLQGYYELEVGGSGETIWVPINGVVPE